MKKTLFAVLVLLLLITSCTRPVDELIIRKVNSKNEPPITSSADLNTSDSDKLPQITTNTQTKPERLVLIINKKSKKMHLSENCSYAKKILDENKLVVGYSEFDSYLSDGYELCSYCEKHF